MDFLEDITLKKCCYCIDLKIACYIIATLSVLILVPTSSGAVEHCYTATGVTKAIICIGIFMFILALASGIFFIYGLCTEVRLPTMVYMVVLLIAMLLTLITAALILTQKPSKGSCPDSVALAVSAIIEIAVHVYCFVIVNSYRVIEE